MEKAGITTGKFVAGIVIAILVSSAVSIGISTQLIRGPQGPAGTAGDTGPAGANGATWWNGTGTPNTSLGSNGDFYLNLANGDVYNRVTGLWSIVANVHGAMGQTGVQGVQGAQGPQGPPGPQGPYLPDYDSGWVNITDKAGQYFTLTHNLNSTDIHVDVTGQIWKDGGAHQIQLGLTGYSSGFEKTYGSSHVGRSLIQTADGGYAIAGYTWEFLNDVYLVKTDAAGQMEWNKTYGGASFDEGYSVVQTADGGYAIAGTTQSYGAGGTDVYLIKTDATGNMQWNRTYGGTGDEHGRSLIQTPDGGYAIAGFVYPYVYLVKTNAAGAMQWNKTYGGANGNWGYSLIQTIDGGYAITGEIHSVGTGVDVCLVKTDSAGTMQWNKTYGGTAGEWGASVVQTADGGYAIAGTISSLGSDIYLVKTDVTGAMQWSNTYGVGDSSGSSVVQTADLGYAIAGTTNTYSGSVEDAYLVKTDAVGVMQWDALSERMGTDNAYSMIQTVDGGYVMAGSSSVGAYPQVYLVKTPVESGLAWLWSTASTITLYRGATDMYWNYVRVRIWKVGTHDHKVGLILATGGLGDKSFNDISYAGVQRAKDELGADFSYVEPTAITEYEAYQRAFAATGDYDIIICVGFDQTDALTIVAAEYPSQKFAIVDATVDKPNVVSLLFKQNEGSFLVGVTAGMKTHSGKVGFIGGMDIALVRDFFVGYEAGAKWANSTVEVVAPVFVGSWADPASGKALALGLADLGVDVIYAAAGKSGLGVLEAVHERGILGLGVDACQCYLYPEIIASMTKRVDVAVFEMIEAALVGTFVGGIKNGGLKEQWVGSCRLPEEQPFWEAQFGFTHSFLEATVIGKMDEARDKIVAGEIIVPTAL